jgi:AcrR family transcriptional regulator
MPARSPETARAQRSRAVAITARPPSRHVERPDTTTAEPRNRVREMQRARLLAAAVASIAEAGYAQLSVTQLVARAGVSRGTFYELFADREDVFLAVFDDAVAEIRAAVAEAGTPNGKWEECVRAYLETMLGVLEEEPALARLCLVESQQAGVKVQRRRTEIIDGLARIVDQGREDGRGRRGGGAPPLTAHSVVAGAVSVVHERLLSTAAGPLSELVGPLMSIIVFPFRGPEAAAAELGRPARKLGKRRQSAVKRGRSVPLDEVGSRLTYRSMLVLVFVAEHPEANNREVADGVGITDQGQISKLLIRLASLGLLENAVESGGRGIANAWLITPKGNEIRRAAQA